MRLPLRPIAGLLALGATVGCNDDAPFPWYLYADADGSGADVSDAGGDAAADTGSPDVPGDALDDTEPDTTVPDTGGSDTGDTDPFDTTPFDTGSFDTGSFDTGPFDTGTTDTFEPPDTDVDVEVPTTGLRVELTWETPGATGSGDAGFGSGADLDLHLVRGFGCWEDAVTHTDCYYASRSPEWGAPGPDDNPTLLLDDIDGVGPEIIVVPEPEPGVVYRIGVHYYADNAFGPSTAFVRILLDDEELFEASFELEQTDAWVYAADVLDDDAIMVGTAWETRPPCP